MNKSKVSGLSGMFMVASAYSQDENHLIKKIYKNTPIRPMRIFFLKVVPRLWPGSSEVGVGEGGSRAKNTN